MGLLFLQGGKYVPKQPKIDFNFQSNKIEDVSKLKTLPPSNNNLYTLTQISTVEVTRALAGTTAFTFTRNALLLFCTVTVQAVSTDEHSVTFFGPAGASTGGVILNVRDEGTHIFPLNFFVRAGDIARMNYAAATGRGIAAIVKVDL